MPRYFPLRSVSRNVCFGAGISLRWTSAPGRSDPNVGLRVVYCDCLEHSSRQFSYPLNNYDNRTDAGEPAGLTISSANAIASVLDQPIPISRAQRHLPVAGLICYGFHALDFMMLTLALPLMIAEWHLTLGQAGLLGTAGMVGVGLSALVLGWYADHYGRRPALLASVVIFALFTAGIALARNRWEVVALRFIAGFGIG